MPLARPKNSKLWPAVLPGFTALILLGALDPVQAVAQVPSLATIEPSSGAVSTEVIIKGSGFGSFISRRHNQVLFGGVPGIVLSAAEWTDSEIKVAVPFSAGTGPVEVVVGAASAVGPEFTVVEPEITGLTVSQGPVSSFIQVLGRQFGNGVDTGSGRLAGAGRDLRVLFNGVPGIVSGQFCCNLSGWTDEEITVTVPFSATTGSVAVQIRAFDIDLDTGIRTPGFVTVQGPTFTVVEPEITGLTVSQGPVSSFIQVLGRQFGNGVDSGSGRLAGAGRDLQVLFNGVPGIVSGQFCCNLSGWTDEEITVTVPLSAATGPVEVRIRAFDIDLDTGSRRPGFVLATGPSFTVKPPTLTALDPDAAPVATRVTVQGEDLSTNSSRLNRLLFDDRESRVLGWEDREVAVEVPLGLRAGQVSVHAQVRGLDLTEGGQDCCVAGFVDSNLLSFEVGNTPPVADAGLDQSARVGDIVTLDGSTSFDVNQDPLTFSWRLLTQPPGSSAALSDPDLSNPQFIVDQAGTYSAELIVRDGIEDSPADTVTVSTVNSAPVADAGPDQAVTLGDRVVLDGGASFDPDGDPLTFAWTLEARPAGSIAELDDPRSSSPSFVVDTFGTYDLALVVRDGVAASAPDRISISTTNVRPTANAGPDQAVRVGEIVVLDGRGSEDPEGQPLRFDWSFLATPGGSLAALSDPSSSTPSFVPDVRGNYLLQLIVGDGLADSLPDTASITAFSPDSVLELVGLALDLVATAPTSAFVHRNSARALSNKLEAVIRQVEDGSLPTARDQLTGDLIPKLDGCAARGAADPPGRHVRDWIVDCEVQIEAHELLVGALDTLDLLLE